MDGDGFAEQSLGRAPDASPGVNGRRAFAARAAVLGRPRRPGRGDERRGAAGRVRRMVRPLRAARHRPLPEPLRRRPHRRPADVAGGVVAGRAQDGARPPRLGGLPGARGRRIRPHPGAPRPCRRGRGPLRRRRSRLPVGGTGTAGERERGTDRARGSRPRPARPATGRGPPRGSPEGTAGRRRDARADLSGPRRPSGDSPAAPPRSRPRSGPGEEDRRDAARGVRDSVRPRALRTRPRAGAEGGSLAAAEPRRAADHLRAVRRAPRQRAHSPRGVPGAPGRHAEGVPQDPAPQRRPSRPAPRGGEDEGDGRRPRLGVPALRPLLPGLPPPVRRDPEPDAATVAAPRRARAARPAPSTGGVPCRTRKSPRPGRCDPVADPHSLP